MYERFTISLYETTNAIRLENDEVMDAGLDAAGLFEFQWREKYWEYLRNKNEYVGPGPSSAEK